MKNVALLIYQESPDISDILLSSFNAKSLHLRFECLWIDA